MKYSKKGRKEWLRIKSAIIELPTIWEEKSILKLYDPVYKPRKPTKMVKMK